MENVIWSSNITKDNLLNSSESEKLSKLIEIGYDPEMLLNSDLDDIIMSDDLMFDSDYKEFDYVIAPEIEKQTYNGIVLLVDNVIGKGFASYVRDIIDISSDVEEYSLVESEAGLTLVTKEHDSAHYYDLFAIPEATDRMKDFIEICLANRLTEVQSMHELDYIEAIEEIKSNELDDIESLNMYCDFSSVSDVCDHISLSNTSMNESVNLNEVRAKDPETLATEYEEIKALSDEYGKEYFTSMPFSAFEDDPITIEAQYPNFAKVVKSFFKEMLDEDPNDPEAMDYQWDVGLDDHDWDVLMTVCKKLVTKNAKGEYPNMQIEKIFKNNFDDGLSDGGDN